MKSFQRLVAEVGSFTKDEDGAQIVEYALIIAVVSIALVVAISAVTTNGGITGWIARVQTCLTTNACI